LPTATLGRSHRSPECLARIQLALDLTRDILGIPADHRLALLPGGGDTGAYEAALWSLVGAKGVPVEALVWDAFGSSWYDDLVNQLRIKDVRLVEAPYGELPDLSTVNAQDHDLCFVWNGTTSGVCLPDDGAPWIPASSPGRGRGLTVCDATSACFCMNLPWDKLDVTTFSWQKALGGEGAHGIIILSPRALARLEENAQSGLLASRQIPKLLRVAGDAKTGKVPGG
jgi:phosphoserine aminotransferase